MHNYIEIRSYLKENLYEKRHNVLNIWRENTFIVNYIKIKRKGGGFR